MNRKNLEGGLVVTLVIGEMEVVEQSSKSWFRCSSARLTKRGILPRQKANNKESEITSDLAAGVDQLSVNNRSCYEFASVSTRTLTLSILVSDCPNIYL